MRFLILISLTLTLSGCGVDRYLTSGGSKPALQQNIIACYQVNEATQEGIQLTFVTDGGQWYPWRNYASSRRVSDILSAPQNWMAFYQGRMLANVTSNASYFGNKAGLLSLQNSVSGLVQAPLVRSEIAYPGMMHRPVLLVNYPTAQNAAVWRHEVPSKAIVGLTLGAFDNFIENGLIEKNTLAAEDLQVIDGAALRNGDRILTLAVSTLTNRDDGCKEKRFKSFYITGDRIFTDLSPKDDVNLNNPHSTGLNLRFIDAVGIGDEVVALFWYWDGFKKGYRLYAPKTNQILDMDV